MTLANKISLTAVIVTIVGIVIPFIYTNKSKENDLVLNNSPVFSENSGDIEINYVQSPQNTSLIEKEMKQSNKILNKINQSISLNIDSINYKNIKDPILLILDSAYNGNNREAKILLKKYHKKILDSDRKIIIKWIEFFHKNKFPEKINSIIFNANNIKESEINIGSNIQKYINGFSYYPNYSWYKKEIYKESKIIYISPEYKKISKYISFILFRHEKVINYHSRHNFQGLDDRDIAIFVGKDYNEN